MKVGNRVCKDMGCLKKEVKSYIRDHFKNDNLPRMELPRDKMRKITREAALELERPVTLKEIRDAVWNCGIDKALGLDGFNFKFFREIWNEIGVEIFCIVKKFLDIGILPESLNVTWVTLIPKVSSPSSLKDFRPISLVGRLYKIIAKVLSLRLEEVMNQVLDESQFAFIYEKHILNGVFIVNESIT